MKKIKKVIRAIFEVLKNPWLLNNVINDDAVWNKYLEKKYKIKKGLPVLDINQISENFSETLHCFAFLDGGSMPTDIALLKVLAKKFNGCIYFEIGTWRGESVVNVADVTKECYTLNLSKEEILANKNGEKYADLQGYFSKNCKNIFYLSGNSLTFDFSALNKKFDLIFIDGNHHHDYVKSDTENIFKHLMHDKTIVVWHDYAYSPEKVRPEVLAAILDGVPFELRKYLFHVSNTLCAVFVRNEFQTSELDPPIVPDKKFKITIENERIL